MPRGMSGVSRGAIVPSVLRTINVGGAGRDDLNAKAATVADTFSVMSGSVSNVHVSVIS